MTQPAPSSTIVRRDANPLVLYCSGTAIIGWCVWVEKTTYSDGTVVETIRESERPQNNPKPKD